MDPDPYLEMLAARLQTRLSSRVDEMKKKLEVPRVFTRREIEAQEIKMDQWLQSEAVRSEYRDLLKKMQNAYEEEHGIETGLLHHF